MFQKILIANRGEIACRVIKTARRMGIRTVAVYSDADKEALHVQMADEAVAIGPSPAAQSYLRAEQIVAACQLTKAEAVHPGYGFLSEKRAFQEALSAAGVVFIGPDAPAIAAMGDKIESKKLAKHAGVSTVPGYLGVIADAEEAVRIAIDIGYPVMIKASAGGGGKGMRLARNDSQVREGFLSARNEARSAFADDRVFIEKYIEHPRHIEIQVLGDSFGHIIHLGERECSIQRRHQKVIEEAPSPFLTPAKRAQMGAQAIALAKAVQYQSAGTVEFIVDSKRNFYFLEMNTRLQVEHPVTELVTGLDLVEWMIRIAAGEPLTLRQSDIEANGWAVEARVYAEDPLRKFLPSTGRLTAYRPPPESPNLRLDAGVSDGGAISMFYDPMIAKLCGYGQTREQAVTALKTAIDSYYIRGVSHNLPFLAALLDHPRFAKGKLSTNFIADEFPDGFQHPALTAEKHGLFVAVAAFLHRRQVERDATISGQMPGHEVQISESWVVKIGASLTPVTLTPIDSGYRLDIEGRSVTLQSDWRFAQPLFSGLYDDGEGRPIVVMQIDRLPLGYRLSHGPWRVDVMVLTPRAAELSVLMPYKQPPDLGRFLLSPMPGLLVSLAVAVGQDVKEGDVLAVVEAMKMENILKAERDGVIATLHAVEGASLAVDQKILEFAP